MSVTGEAIWYIESHLDEDLSLEGVAEIAGVSRFHLSRAFAVSTGSSLAAYLRARRLSEAAKVLAGGAPDILAVALDAGYGSHEAFTRAFRLHFGMTPEGLRARASLEDMSLQEPFEMERIPMNPIPTDQAKPTPPARPRMIRRNAMLLFGLSQRCRGLGDASIPSQWNSFVPHVGHIDGQAGNVTYGVIYNSGDSSDYDYLCGVEVRDFPVRPAEFTRLRIPPQTYAVFEHPGHVSGIAGTWRTIWEHALPASGFEATDGPAFERYDERFDGRTGLGGLEIWIPVKAAAA